MRVELAEPAPQDGREDVEQDARREDRVVGGDADGALRDGQGRDRAHARVVGRVQVHDVDVEPLEEPLQLQHESGRHGVDGLRGVAVERHADAEAHDLEPFVDDRPGVLVGDRRRAQEMPCHDRHLVAAPCELARLTVDVLGDAAKHRVVVIGDDGDPHAGARASISGSPLLGTLDARVPVNRGSSGYTAVAMPIYEYLCTDGHRVDVVQKFADEALTKCEVCGKPAQRVLHAPSIHFKGKGFYATDYGKGGKSANGDKASDSGSSSDSGSKESAASSSGTATRSRSPRARTPPRAPSPRSSESKSSGGDGSSSKKPDKTAS